MTMQGIKIYRLGLAMILILITFFCTALGSANLTDGIWRFAEADQLASIKYTITHGVNDATDPMTRQAQMPTFGGGKLSTDDIKKLAVYVHQLGGGQ